MFLDVWNAEAHVTVRILYVTCGDKNTHIFSYDFVRVKLKSNSGNHFIIVFPDCNDKLT